MDRLVRGGLPLHFTAYDGSSAGPPDADVGMQLRTERGLAYLMTAPGDLGMARAYVSGDLQLSGVHPGDPYDALVLLKDHTKFRVPAPSEAVHIARSLGLTHLRPPPPPPQEHLPRWRRAVEGLRHSMTRDAGVISHHYDVSNRFYELVLGPSMAYTCALYETPDMSLEEAQAAKFELVCRKLDLQPGQRLLDVGCGWGAMVRHAAREHGVRALGVTLSLEQAQWAKEAIDREGLGDLAEVRHLDYRDVVESGFDAVSSIGLTEHIGVRNYPAYFRHLRDRLRPGGRLLNHSITRRHNRRTETGPLHRPLRLPRRGADRLGHDHQRRAGPGARGAAQREPAPALRRARCATGTATSSSTGTSAWPRSARGRPACGASTSPARGSASSATRSSCTRCSRPATTTTAAPTSRCAPTGEPPITSSG